MNGTIGQMYWDVVEEATTLNLFNTPTDNPNNEMGQGKKHGNKPNC